MNSLNFATAQYYYRRSLDKASRLNDRSFSIPAEMNMSEVCRITGDTLGIQLDMNLFNYAVSKGEPMLLFTTGLHCATYFAESAKDTTELKPYIDAMRTLDNGSMGAVNMVFARFFFNQGDYSTAEKYVRKLDTDQYTDFKVLYAAILNKMGQYSKSDSLLAFMPAKLELLNYRDRIMAFNLRSDNMAAQGRWSEAFSRNKEYDEYRDSMESASTNDLMKRYRIEYETYTKDRYIKEQKARIINMEIIVIAVVVLLIVIVVAYTIYTRHRRRLFRDIVQQNIDFMKLNNDMQGRLASRDAVIAELKEEMRQRQETVPQKKILPAEQRRTVSDEKADEIFERILDLTDKKKVWRDLSLTRDSFAEMVGCNRTYLAEVLKAKTDMGYSQFMNSCRIKEAMAILSDPGNETTLNELYQHLGFLSIGTFYKAFKQQIGMSPAAFRKTAREL